MPLAATWMDPETVILSEASQTEEESYMWNLNYTNELIFKTETYKLKRRNLTVTGGKSGREE